jgi:phospholipase A1
MNSCHERPINLRALAVLVALIPALPAAAEDLASCARIVAPNERLACYDALAAETGPTGQISLSLDSEPLHAPDPQDSAAQRRIADEAETLDNPFSLTAYRPNYLLPLTYNSKKHAEPFREQFPGIGMDDIEAKFQISFKARLWEFTDRLNVWGAYTQENWWQLYNDDESAPFRETDYQPEVFLAYTPVREFFGWRVPAVNLGYNHQSNGRGGELSRSWNRIIAGTVLERRNLLVAPRVWWRIPEDDRDDDNPRTDDFLGYGDLRLAYEWHDMTFAALLRNNLRSEDNRGAVQLDWSFPINRRFKGYVQYFYGYGESLIDYDAKTNRLGVGIMLTDIL